MTNEVTIKVKSEDDTDFDKIKANSRREMGKAGTDSSKSFGSSVKKWFTGEGGGLFAEVGKSGGTVFGSGMLGALKTPILGPLLVGAVGAAAATAMPAVGAIAGGALVTGFGAGLAGLGVIFAAKSETVKRVWSDTMSDLGDDMELLSRPFEDTLVGIATDFRRTFDAFKPHLGRAFANMADPIEDFVDDGTDALEELIPAIDPVTDAFNEVLGALGPALQSALREVSDGLIDLANSVAENPEALADTVEGVGSLANEALGLITTLSDLNGEFADLTGGTSAVDVVFGMIESSVVAVNAAFGTLEAVVGGVNAVLGTSGADAATAGASMNAAADQVTKAARAYSGLGPSASGAVGSMGSVTNALARQKAQFSATIEAMGQWSSKALASSNAAIAYEAALDDATASLKANGETLNINTEKGRANRTALNNLAAAANAQGKAMDEAGASNVAVAAKAESSRKNFVKLATQMGMSKTAAERLAAQLISIPNVTREAKLKANKADLTAKLEAAKRELANPKLTATKRANITATIKSLQEQINAAQRKINSLQGKTVTIRSRFITERIARNQSGADGGHVPGDAHGGLTPPGLVAVGEFGPEIAEFPPGTHIRPAGTSRRMMAEASTSSAPAPVVIQLDGRGLSGLERVFLDWLQGALRKNPQVKLVTS